MQYNHNFKINDGELEREGWRQLGPNFYRKGVFNLWFYSGWTLEIAPDQPWKSPKHVAAAKTMGELSAAMDGVCKPVNA